jgi:GNAT superfamily N-acetyltransferase
MNCTIQFATDFYAGAAEYVRDHLTKPGSDFQRKLDSWLYDSSEPTEDDGYIALVEDHGEIIGWARTEKWLEAGADQWNTLEAFVHKSYRRRGIAAFAASGLYSPAMATRSPSSTRTCCSSPGGPGSIRPCSKSEGA